MVKLKSFKNAIELKTKENIKNQKYIAMKQLK